MPAPKYKNVGWHLRKLGIPALWSDGVAGRGVRVAILDTGQARVPGLTRSTFEYLDHDGNTINAIDLVGHGTAAASIVGSSRTGVYGIAPRVSISSYRVLDSGDLARKAERALTAIVARPDIDVVLCAFILDKVSTRFKELVRALASRGTVVVASAGNDAGATSAFPEHTPHAITVAGVTTALAPIPKAQRGPWIDISAPGDRLRALDATGAIARFGESSGAAAVVAGVAALVLGTQRSRPKRRKLGIMFEGIAKAQATSLPHAPAAVGKGLVNPKAILKVINEGL